MVAKNYKQRRTKDLVRLPRTWRIWAQRCFPPRSGYKLRKQSVDCCELTQATATNTLDMNMSTKKTFLLSILLVFKKDPYNLGSIIPYIPTTRGLFCSLLTWIKYWLVVYHLPVTVTTRITFLIEVRGSQPKPSFTIFADWFFPAFSWSWPILGLIIPLKLEIYNPKKQTWQWTNTTIHDNEDVYFFPLKPDDLPTSHLSL